MQKSFRSLSTQDLLLAGIGRALRTLSCVLPPGASGLQQQEGANLAGASSSLSESERTKCAAMMRVNHAGEVCAQALYEGQALLARNPELRVWLHGVAEEEGQHLCWTLDRLQALRGKPSRLTPFWYFGSLAIGMGAGSLGNTFSLSFMAETERQVEQHLTEHIHALPPNDRASRAVLERMRAEETEHAHNAMMKGGRRVPLPVAWAMSLCAKLMTRTAYYF